MSNHMNINGSEIYLPQILATWKERFCRRI